MPRDIVECAECGQARIVIETLDRRKVYATVLDWNRWRIVKAFREASDDPYSAIRCVIGPVNAIIIRQQVGSKQFQTFNVARVTDEVKSYLLP